MPADRDVPPTRYQRWLLKHKTAYRAATATVACAGAIFGIWMTVRYGPGYWWLIMIGLALSTWVAWRVTAELEQSIARYDSTHHATEGDGQVNLNS